MLNFMQNMAIVSWMFVSWYLVGIGPTLALLSSSRRREALLLAPLVGMCLIVVMGVFQITVLLTPLLPRSNVISLMIISMGLTVWVLRGNKQFNFSLKDARHFLYLCILPFILLLSYAWLFHGDGFHLLVGSSDQLQYCQNARHILEEMHTGSARDIPIPRQNYFLYDMATRLLVYSKEIRRGADVMLATMTSISGLSFEETFPVIIISAILSLGFALGFLGRVYFSLSLFFCIILQLAFLSSFYLMLVHVQGSLALIMGMGPNLIALALLTEVVGEFSWRCLIFAALMVTSYLAIYSDPALVSIILPSIFLVAWQFYFSWKKGLAACWHVALIYFLVMLCTPFVIYSVIFRLTEALGIVLHALSFAPHASMPEPVSIVTILQQWTLAGAVLGAMSYYDFSVFNTTIAVFFSRTPAVILIIYFGIAGLGLLGYVRTKNLLARLFAVILILWLGASILLSYKLDFLRFTRSLHYALPFIIFGLILLSNRTHKMISNHKSEILVIGLGRIVLTGFILINIYTCVRTINYLAGHDVGSDVLVLRFDERKTPWRNLKNELQISAQQNVPVLLSGFQNTIWPVAISAVIRNQPQVVGESILSFWPIYNLYHKYPRAHFNTRLSQEAFYNAEQKENKPWALLETNFIQHSLQAVVPVGNGYPVEWSSTRDVYAPRIKRFTNICDVIYRYDYAISLAKNMLAPLAKDAEGPFRFLNKSGPVIIKDQFNSPQELIFVYDGKVGDIKLRIGKEYREGVLDKHGQVRLAANITPDQVYQLNLEVRRPVKLRTISWEPII